MHSKSKSFFANHSGIDELFYTSDGQHFKTEAGAQANAVSLKKKGKGDTVTRVTRAECDNGSDGGTVTNNEPTVNDVVLTTPQKIALTKAKNNANKLLLALEEAKKGNDADTIASYQADYDAALAAWKALPGYSAE